MLHAPCVLGACSYVETGMFESGLECCMATHSKKQKNKKNCPKPPMITRKCGQKSVTLTPVLTVQVTSLVLYVIGVKSLLKINYVYNHNFQAK